MKKRTRLKITYIVMVALGIVTFVAISKQMENLAIACIGAITGAGLGYVWGESQRPSS